MNKIKQGDPDRFNLHGIQGWFSIYQSNQIKSNQFIVQHNITYKKFTKIIQAYYHYGCTMESGEARLLEP